MPQVFVHCFPFISPRLASLAGVKRKEAKLFRSKDTGTLLNVECNVRANPDAVMLW